MPRRRHEREVAESLQAGPGRRPGLGRRPRRVHRRGAGGERCQPQATRVAAVGATLLGMLGNLTDWADIGSALGALAIVVVSRTRSSPSTLSAGGLPMTVQTMAGLRPTG